MGDYFETDGVYLRRFAKALVAVAPMHRGDKRLELDRTYYTPEGEEVSGTLKLKEGHGVILLDARPPAPPKRLLIDDFEQKDLRTWKYPVRDPNTRVVEEDGNHFLRARVASDALQPYHERRLQTVRSLTPYDTLRFRIRTTDKTGAVLIRVEVSDHSPTPTLSWTQVRHGVSSFEDTRTPFVALVVKPASGSFSFEAKGKDIPYGILLNKELRPIPGVLETGSVPYFAAPVNYRADNRWQTVELNVREALTKVAPYLATHRIGEMRLIGDADLDNIVIER